MNALTWQTVRDKIPDWNSWLLTGLFFCIPIHVAPAYLLTGLMAVLWLAEGRYGEKWARLRGNSLLWVFLAFFVWQVISLVWTEDLESGWKTVGRYYLMLFAPLYLSVVRREHIERYLIAFMLSIALSELLAFYNWARLHVWTELPRGIQVKKDRKDTAPFVDHILYTPLLAMAGYLAGHKLLFGLRQHKERWLYGLLLAATTLNLIIAGGRTGLLAFCLLLVLLAIQKVRTRPWLAAGGAVGLIVVLLGAGYFGNQYFRERVDEGVEQAMHFGEKVNTPVGQRLTFFLNTLTMIAEQPLLGVGVGDFAGAYAEINQRVSPLWSKTRNPHSQYLMSQATTGIVGLLLLFAVYLPPGFWRRPYHDGYDHHRVALVALFLFISLLESYLWRSNTKLLFVLFSCAFYAFPPDASTTQVRADASASEDS